MQDRLYRIAPPEEKDVTFSDLLLVASALGLTILAAVVVIAQIVLWVAR